MNITPEVYYDLTVSETAALLEGAAERQIDRRRNTRILATLLRNAHFEGSVTEVEYMPLPGDEPEDTDPVIEMSGSEFMSAWRGAFRGN